MFRWIITGLIAVVVVLAATGAYLTRGANERVMEEIRRNPDGERAAETMIISFEDRILPVNYLRDDDVIYIGVDGPWWRTFREGNVPVDLFVQGQTLTGRARVELEDQAFVDDVFSRLRPTAPDWLPDWANGRLVIIDID